MINTAQFGLLILLSLFLLLHFMILLKLIPYNFIWGGRLKSKNEMYRFEIISILINAFFIMIILVQANFWMINIPNKIITYALWLMAGLFVFNSLGNALSKNKIERMLFTPVTIVMAIFSLVLALSN